MATGLSMAAYPQKLVAEGFTGEEFLTWSDAAQDSYFQTSITMAAIMASKTYLASGDCLGDWYLSAEADRGQRHTDLREAIERNATYHPSAVIYLVLEEACGPFLAVN